MGGGDFFFFQLYSICCVIWGLAGVCVCLAGLGSFPLLIVSVHPSLSAPTCPTLPPDLATNTVLLLRHR